MLPENAVAPVTDSKFPLSHFVGQQTIKVDLEAKIARAKQRSDILPHLLFCGPDESGKKTLAKCVAHEMGVNVRITNGAIVNRPGDLVAFLTNCDEGDLFVITACESLNEEILALLIGAIQNYQIDIEVAVKLTIRIIKLPLKRFTLACTTSRPSQVDKRLRRWLISYDLAAYARNELMQIITRLASEDGWSIENGAAELLAGFAAGSPGDAKVLLKRACWHIGTVSGKITTEVAREALVSLGYLDRPQNPVDLVSKVHAFNGVDFEKFVANVFRSEGYFVEMTQATGDHGIDLLMRKDNQLFAVQCKRWDAPVGESVVRDFFGSLMGAGAQFGYLVVSSTFTSRAYAFAQNKPMKLIDLDGLLELAARHPLPSSF